MRKFLVTTLLILFPIAAYATDCQSVGGHMNGKPVIASRHIYIKNNIMTVSGLFNNTKSPIRKLSCRRMQTGFYCERTFGPVLITVVTNRDQLIETVTDGSGREVAGIAYVCNQPIK